MTDTTTDTAAPDAAAPAPRKSSGGLGGKVLAELQEIAAGLNIDGAASMRKGALIDAIKTARGDAPAAPKAAKAPKAEKVEATQPETKQPETKQPEKSEQPAAEAPAAEAPAADEQPARRGRRRGQQARTDEAADTTRADTAGTDTPDADKNQGGEKNQGNRGGRGNQAKDAREKDGQKDGQKDAARAQDSDDAADGNGGGNRQGRNQNRGGEQPNQNRQQNKNQDQPRQNRQQGNQQDLDDDEDGTGRRRNRRGRNRTGRGMETEPTYSEDDVLVPAAGILDILDNYAFVRTTGYLPSENDVYVSLSMVRKWGLRRGDAVTGQVRQPREGERKEKFNPMVKVETVNGMSLEESAKRVEFSRLVPLHPSERLRLEGAAGGATGRVVDLVAPLGKGQRGLIVSPPKAGKTVVLQQIAHAITENNPECHLMVVLIDERPEEVTDFQRSIKGEVIASTFDRAAGDHTTVAELAIERAKRLVELGHDVVVLLDGITRLGRAYNLAAASGGRVLSGDVDASALHPPKQFFGAARNIEDGGSLTILATAVVETGSRIDEIIFDEFTDAGNWELRLRRDLADLRVFPAVDVVASSTIGEELLLTPEEVTAVTTLRRSAAAAEGRQGLVDVLERIAASPDNATFLRQL